MPEDSMKRLSRSNPVADPPRVNPFVAPDKDQAEVLLVRRARRHARRNGALALTGLAGAAAVSVLLASGSSKGPVDVLAAVYAATAPHAGIVESVAVIHNDPNSAHSSTERVREWLDAYSSSRRADFTIPNPHRTPSTHTIELSYSPGRGERWTATGNSPGVIQRALSPKSMTKGDTAFYFGGGLTGEQVAQRFRTLYLKHQLRVAGRVRRNGELLWKLEETPAGAQRRAREDHTSYYMLVNPHTFQLVYTRLIDLAQPGHPTVTEMEVNILRTLPATPTSQQLFDLSLQHPHARIETYTLPRHR